MNSYYYYFLLSSVFMVRFIANYHENLHLYFNSLLVILNNHLLQYGNCSKFIIQHHFMFSYFALNSFDLYLHNNINFHY